MSEYFSGRQATRTMHRLPRLLRGIRHAWGVAMNRGCMENWRRNLDHVHVLRAHPERMQHARMTATRTAAAAGEEQGAEEEQSEQNPDNTGEVPKLLALADKSKLYQDTRPAEARTARDRASRSPRARGLFAGETALRNLEQDGYAESDTAWHQAEDRTAGAQDRRAGGMRERLGKDGGNRAMAGESGHSGAAAEELVGER